MTPTKFGTGAAVRRKEDDALLRGAGRFVADLAPANLCRAVVLRSPHAHARFRIRPVDAARRMPGVRLVLTADDIAELGPLPCGVELPGARIVAPPYRLLADGEVRHVGDAIAFVVADTVEQAKDAAEAIEIDWEALPHVVDAVAALAPGAPLVWADLPGNLAFETTLGDKDATERAFATADRVVSLTLVNQRLVTNYLDTRAVVAEYDAASDRITLTLGSQGSHAVRDIIGKMVLKMPAEKLRVITPGCRRRLRHQALPVSRIRARGGGGQAPRRAGEVGGRAQRAFPRRQPGPRQHHDREARARRRRENSSRSTST